MSRVLRYAALGCAALFAIFLVLSPPSVHAQTAVAEVSGTVTDPSGAAVASANVNLVETERGVSHPTVTDSSGHYVMPNLPVGPYRLEVSSAGFKTYIRFGIILQVSDHAQVNLTLQVGVVSESVEVHAAAAMVQTTQNSISQVVDSRRMIDLPLNGRSATQLVLLSGASVAATVPSQDITSGKSVWAGVTVSVGGGQANGTNYLLDGGNNIETAFNVNLPFPFPDALQEFSVETNALPARNGTQPGGLVNVVTKSGSNGLHGDLFEFLRNGDVNARNFFAATHDSLKRNQYGGVLGGRIIKDKLFFFGGYQGTRNRTNPPSTVSYVPTAPVLNGDFSTFDSAGCQSTGRAKTVTDPLTKAAFPGNLIPVSRLDPAAVKLASYLPATTNPCGKVTYGVPTTGDEDQFIGRVDWARSSKHSLFGRYFMAQFSNPGADPLTPIKNVLVSNRAGNLERSQSITLGDTYTFGPTMVNSAHATFTRVRNNRSPAPNMIGPETIGSNVFPLDPHDLYVTVTGDFTVSCNACNHGVFNVNTYDFADSVDLIRGKHQLAFGADFMRTQNNLIAYASANPAYTFSGAATGEVMADFLLGTLSTFQQNRPQAETLRQSVPALYIQDTYHVTKRLVVNAGLRWEPMFFPVDYFHRGSVFSMAGFLAGKQTSQVYPNAPAGTSYYGDPGVPPGFTKNSPWNFSPRLGFVWDPNGDGKQTIRFGAGIMYDSAEVFFPQRVMANSPFGNPVILSASAPGGFGDPWVTGYHYPGGNPYPNPFEYNPTKSATIPVSAQWVLLPDQMKPTNLVQWNVSYQRQFGTNWLASVTYMGNKTTHLWASQEINPGVFIPGTCGSAACSTTSNTNSRRVMYLLNPTQGQYYGLMDMSYDGANANYNAMLVSVQHRFSQGFTLLANYTRSHCLSDTDFRGDNTGPSFQNPNNLRQDYGNCAFDVPHVVNVSMVATSPLKGKDLAGRLLGNWQLAPLIRRVSGIPINILTGKDNSLTGVGLDRPNQVLPNVYNSTLGPQLQYLNAAAFSPNALGTFGNVGRDSIRGPGQFNFDLALSRYFAITEHLRLEARAEAFNAINHTNFAPNLSVGISSASVPSGSVSSPSASSGTFGQITGAGDPRILQFALKLVF